MLTREEKKCMYNNKKYFNIIIGLDVRKIQLTSIIFIAQLSNLFYIHCFDLLLVSLLLNFFYKL